MNRNVLVTGGAGFIGINLVNYLLDDKNVNYKIIIVDNMICSNSFFGEILNEWYQEFPDRVDFYPYNISKPDFVELIKTNYEHIDEIYHLASIASPIIYKKNPFETLDVSYLGSKHVFELTNHYKNNDNKTCKTLIASTSEIYGDPSISPQPETYFGNVNCYGFRSCYDEGKRIMETLAFEYQKEYGCDIKIARIFNTYGPFMNIKDGRIIPSLIESFLCEKPIQIFNGGKQTRCFNYIDDTLNGLINLMNSQHYQPVNIGNDTEYSIIETYEKMKDIFETKYSHLGKRTDLEIEWGTSDENDPKIRQPDLKRAKEWIQYEITTPFEEGVCKTIDYFIHYFEQKAKKED